jgi:hypothetical protein
MTESEPAARGRPYWIGLGAGVAIMLFGVAGAVVNSDATHPVQFATWLIGADVLHDVVVAPLVCAIGWLVVTLLPSPVRAPVRAALLTTAVLVVIGWAPLRGYGRLRDNPSLAPLDYRSGLLTAVGLVWAACALWVAAGLVRAGHGRATRGRDPAAGAVPS